MAEKKLENILNMTLDQVMSDRFGRYSKYIIQGRALPDTRDGLKPVQRRILFSMSELGLTHNKPFKKSARVVGDVIGKYHPHGDSSIYEAMVRMSQHWKMNIPLIDMHGNNGSIDDDPAAAMRYTEARLAKISETMLNGINKNTVIFAPNFDDSEREPTVLPALAPNLLINGAKGIAAGYATEMPPHNLGEVVDAIMAKIKNPEISLRNLLKYIKGPDFPTGGIIQGSDGIFEAFHSGRGRLVIRSKYEIVDTPSNHAIYITEIPFGIVKSKLVRDIDELRFEKNIAGLKDVRDESDRNGISICLELTKDANANNIIKFLLSKTDLQVYYTYNNIAIKDNAPQQLGLIDLIDSYLVHQTQVQKSAISFDLEKDKIRLEIVLGLIKVAEISDQVIKVIREAPGSKQGVIQALIDHFEFTELQATAIAELRLYRLSKTDREVYIREKEELEKRIARNILLLGDKGEFDAYLISLLKSLKHEFATPRKSVIENEVEKLDVSLEEIIKHEDIYLGLTQQGYVKRLSTKMMESNELTNYGLKESDFLVYLKKINTVEKILIFTNEGRFAICPTHKFVEDKFKGVGKHLNDYVTLGSNEKIVAALTITSFDQGHFVTLLTKYGKIKRVSLNEFESSRLNKTMTALSLKDDELVGVGISGGYSFIIIVTSTGKATKYLETDIPVQGLKSSGVKAINLADESFATALVLSQQNDQIALISNRGGAKRVKVDKILPMSRNTQGKQLFKYTKTNPHFVVDADVVTLEEQVLFLKNDFTLELSAIKSADLSNEETSFNQIGPKDSIQGKIIKFKSSISGFRSEISSIEKRKPEDVFSDAENAINKISIEDILKNIK